MDADAHRHINTNSDSELLLNIFANNLQKTGKFRINEEDIFTAIGGLMSQATGAYACVAMLAGFGIIAFRDPNGIRPLGIARRSNPGGDDYLCASESVVADASGFTGWEDVKPGLLFIRYTIDIIKSNIIIVQRRGCDHHSVKNYQAYGRQGVNIRPRYIRICLLRPSRLCP